MGTIHVEPSLKGTTYRIKMGTFKHIAFGMIALGALGVWVLFLVWLALKMGGMT